MKYNLQIEEFNEKYEIIITMDNEVIDSQIASNLQLANKQGALLLKWYKNGFSTPESYPIEEK